MKYDHQNWSQIKYNKKIRIHSRRINSPPFEQKNRLTWYLFRVSLDDMKYG